MEDDGLTQPLHLYRPAAKFRRSGPGRQLSRQVSTRSGHSIYLPRTSFIDGICQSKGARSDRQNTVAALLMENMRKRNYTDLGVRRDIDRHRDESLERGK
ncbi:hypothetical protein E5554_01885 [Sphingobium sp. PAMC28499]|uniref:hypothetical protein n=1 Tax=Sphingobium sp. PAMC28499 TaxID=2565554 RepID=UPI00109DC3CE|nr:hypothetical protein [Sphingobium sp. PAMC28499]QCB36712.1 hypothetical protein E5554_01885 [Sphingobium sp. PAMC28499]